MTPLTRRRFLTSTALTATAACLDHRTLVAQATPLEPALVLKAREGAATAKITTHALRGNVSVLMGSGGNIAVLTAKAGKLLVDSGIATSQPQITDALAALGPDPIRILINTHWHYDHTDGNQWVHATGASIWALENTRYRMSTTQHIAAFDATFPPAPTGALPSVLFNSYRNISDSVSTLVLTQYEPAHTDTDISVYFKEADVLHTGDTFFNGIYPFIDYSTGGSIDGMIRAAARNLATGTDATIVIPGHGPVGDKTQLAAFHTMLTTTRASVAALKQQGKSLNETIAAKPTAPFDDTWAKGTITPALFTTLVYQGV
jgi:glyoxylase-like metal-dependent hydrolase (beta-lactamase superfamily II)